MTKKSKWFVLWLLVLVALLVLGGVIIYTGLSDYLNGTRLPHHGKQLAQGIRRVLC